MDVDLGRRSEISSRQHGRPKQGVEVDDIFANKMMHFTIRIGSPVILIIDTMTSAVAFKAGDIPDRRVQPDIKILSGLAGNLKSKIRRVSGNVPVLKSGIEPFRQLVGDSWM